MTTDMLSLLAKHLPDELKGIIAAKNNNDYDDLRKRLHKLHGAVAYCNASELKQSIAALEDALKNKAYAELPELFVQFEGEASRVMQLF